MRICSIGDLLLDVIVRLQEPLAPGDDAVAVTRAAAGGQAANVCAWASLLGADACFVGKRAGDEAGAIAHAALAKTGSEVRGPLVDGRTGVVVSIVGEDGDRTMASDRGVAPALHVDELDDEWFACDWLHVPTYSLAAAPIAEATLAAVTAARARGARISLDLSAATVAGGPAAEHVRALRPDLVFATELEWATLPIEAPEVVVKYGARGFAVVKDGNRSAFEAHDAAAIDTTGAGDALAAGYLVGGPSLAAEAAARCVSQVGAMPA